MEYTINGQQNLKAQMQKALRTQKLRSLLLIAPLLLFVVISFVAPIISMLLRSVDNSIVPETIPRTVVAIQKWNPDQQNLPSADVYKAFAIDLQKAAANRLATRLGSRLNYEKPGMSSLFRKTSRQVSKWNLDENINYKDLFISFNKGWGDPEIWKTIKLYSGSETIGYYSNAIDHKLSLEGISKKDENLQIYQKLFLRTLVTSLLITFLCVLLGYPVAWLLSVLPLKKANLLLIFVLLPFWTSLLVRTSAWKVMLQQQGVINDTLVWMRLVSDDSRLALINNEIGTVIAMTHILLPFMILPMFSVMKTVPPQFVRAAKSLGASDWTSFWRVYFPQSVPGIGAGAILVFILSIGYYITPEIVGGNTGTFISNRIAYHVSSSLNWGLAAALATILLVAVLMLYWIYDRLVGIDNVKLG